MKLRRVLALVMALCLLVGQLPATAWAAEASATITFEDTANRTVFTTEQQVWVVNGITFTNDKAAATSNVADYCNPVRCYAGSSVTVAYPGMTRIEYTCYSSTYAANLQKSIGDTATAADTVVTVAFDAPVDSYLIEKLAAQVRINSVTVYTDAGSEPEDTTAPAEPTEPEETTAPAEPTEPEETTAPAETTEPEETTAPAEPTEPEETTAPAEPTEPEETTAPTDPSEPEETTAPTDPSEPEETEPADPEADSTLSISEAAALGLTKEHNTYTAAKYYVTGKVAAILNTTYGNMHIVDEAGNSLYIYGTYNADGSVRFDAMDPQPAVGDTVTLYGIIGQNNGLAQMKNGWVTEYSPAGEGDFPEDSDPEAGITLSVGEAAALAASKLHNVFTAGKYYVTGVISSIVSAEYGNLYISDEAGNTLYIYGTYNADGTADFSALDPQPALGDTVTVYGILGQYYGTAEMKHGWITEYNSADGNTAYGSCGDALTWRVQDGTLTISGTGAMTEYNFDESGETETVLAPWYSYREKITEVVLEEGLTSITETAMMDLCEIESVTIPASVTQIGDQAFYGCTNLRSVYFLGDAPAFGRYVFSAVSATVYYPAENDTWTEDVMQQYGGTLTWMKKVEQTYPELVLDANTVADVPSGGYAYFQFTPELTDLYCFTSLMDGFDTYGYLYDSEMNLLFEDDDNGEGNNFSITHMLEAGKTYILAVRYYNWESGAFPVLLQLIHSYESEVITEPTCTATGLQRYTCQYCGATYEEEIEPAHSYGENGICTLCGAEWMATGTCGENLTWTLDANGLLTISGTGPMASYGDGESPFAMNDTIKSVVIAEGVTTVSDDAFYGCDMLESIDMPDSITIIGDNAFFSCASLTSVSIPAGIISIALGAFSDCDSLTGFWVDENNAVYSNDNCGVLLNKEQTELICAPGAITSYVVPDSVTSIAYVAFEYNTNLTNITIPASVTSIGSHAFYGCKSLTTVNIPASVIDIGMSAFSDCNQMTGIWVDESNAVYSSDTYGVMFSKDGTELISAPGMIGDYTVPSSVTKICDMAFYNCDKVEYVKIADTVTEIGRYAFSECSSLTQIQIPAGVTAIEGRAFAYSGLTGITLPASLERLGTYVFEACTDLTDIWFLGSAPIIEENAFSGTTVTAYYNGDDTWTEDVMLQYGGDITWVAAKMGSCGENVSWTLDSNGLLIISGTGDMADYSETAAPWSEYTVTSVVIEEGVTSISSGAFAGCSSISGVTLPESMETIEVGAFYGCTGLTEIHFLGDAPVIGENAFEGVTAKVSYPYSNDTWTAENRQNYGGSLTWEEALKLSYPVIERDTETVAEVPEENYAYFQFTPKFTETYFFYSLATNCDPYAMLLDSELNYLTESDDYENLNFGFTYTLEAGVTYVLRIGSYSGASSVPIMLQTQHENVTEIVTEATCSVSGLRRHTCQICGQVTEESYFLDHIFGEDDLCVNCGAVWALTGTCGDNVTWSMNRAGVLTISGTGDMANYVWGGSPFANNGDITSVVIEEGVTSIGSFSFFGCYNLQTVSIAGSVASIGETAFQYCYGLQSVAIPEGVSSIAAGAFYNCSSLSSVTIPASMTGMAPNAFGECYNLNELLVSEESETYCTDASGVLYNKAMTQLLWVPYGISEHYSIPEGVVSIGEQAFQSRYNLPSVTFPESLSVIGVCAFWNCNSLTEVTIPANVTSIGADAFGVCHNMNAIWVDEANAAYSSDASGVLFNKAKTQLIKAPIGLSGAYTIPDGVTVIMSGAFQASNVTSVVIPEGVTEIPDSLFMNCQALCSVSIPASVSGMAGNAFFDCRSLLGIWVDAENTAYCSDSSGVLFNKAMTELIRFPAGLEGSYSIPAGVTAIGIHAFGSSKISGVTIPEGLTCINGEAFWNCQNLTAVTIPASVTEIWWAAFNNCTELETIIFQGNVPYIDGDIFWDVTATAYYPAGNETWTEDVLQSYGGNITWVAAEMGSCGDSLHWTLAEGTLTISGSGDMADYSETAAPWSSIEFTKVTIEAGVTGISSGAFSGCTGLTEIRFLGDAPTIGETACTGVTAEAFYPEGNTTWTEDAMQNYGGTLTWTEKLKLPYPVIQRDTLTAAEDYADGYAFFQFKPTVTEEYFFGVVVDNNSPVYQHSILVDSEEDWVITDSNTNANGIYGFYCTLEAGVRYVFRVQLDSAGTNQVILQTQHEYVTEIVTEATCIEEGLLRHTCPDCGHVTEESYFGDHTYGEDHICIYCGAQDPYAGLCGDTLHWAFDSGVLTISGTGAMYDYEAGTAPWRGYLDQIESLVVEDGVTYIGSYAFAKYYQLMSVSVAGSVTHIGEHAFAHCDRLSSVSLAEGLVSIGDGAFYVCGDLQELAIPASVSSMDPATWLCYSLNELTVAADSETYCNDAYGVLFNKEMTALLWAPRRVTGAYTVPEGVTAIGNSAFRGCRLTDISIADSVVSIGSEAFYECGSLTSILIPVGVASIGEEALGSCDNLLKIEVAEENQHYSSDAAGALFDKEKATLIRVPATVEEYTVPESVTVIEASAFSNSWDLDAVVLGSQVTTIGRYAFINCCSLDEVIIPASVTMICEGAFACCDSLRKIVFEGDAPVMDGEYIFENIFYRAFAYYPANNPSWTENVMQGYGGGVTWAIAGRAVISGASVSLGDSLDMHFFLDPADVAEGDYAVITRTYADGRADSVLTVPYADWTVLWDGRHYVTYSNIAAKEMGDTISMVIYNAEGEAISAQWDDSVKAYAVRMLEKTEDAELRTLLVDMLNYGAAAQSQFGYDTANLVNAGLTDEQKGFATASYETESNLVAGTGRAGTSLTLKSRITLDFIFKNTAIGTDYTGLYAVATYTDHYGNEIETRIDTVKVYNANLGYVSVPGLAVADYAQAVTCTVYDAEGNILAWATDSMEGYAHRMKGSLPQIVETIVKFGNSSYNYFH